MQEKWWQLLVASLRQVEDALVRGMCDIMRDTSLTHQQKVQVQLPHRHGGIGLRRFSCTPVFRSPRPRSADGGI